MEQKHNVNIEREPNKGNQIVIGSNHGTIHVHNSHDSEILKRLIQDNENFNEVAKHFTNILHEFSQNYKYRKEKTKTT